MAKNVKALIKKMNSGWKSTEANVGGFVSYPDDDYIARLDNATLDVNNKTEELQIVMDFTIADGKYKNKTFKKWLNLNEQGMEYAKGDLTKLDMELPDDLSDLPELLTTLEGIYVGMSFVTKEGSEYQNQYIQQVVDADALDIAEDSEEEDEEPKSKKKKTKGKKTAEEPEDEDEEEDEEEEDEDEDDDEEDEDEDDGEEIDVDSMSKPDLVDLCKEQGWKPNKATKTKVAKLRAYVTKKLEAQEEE